jgi:hypothetical protein
MGPPRAAFTRAHCPTLMRVNAFNGFEKEKEKEKEIHYLR